MEKVHYEHEMMKDNTYEGLKNKDDDFCEKAHQTLIITKGKGFTKAKNKLKKQTYRAGIINENQVNSLMLYVQCKHTHVAPNTCVLTLRPTHSSDSD